MYLCERKKEESKGKLGPTAQWDHKDELKSTSVLIASGLGGMDSL